MKTSAFSVGLVYGCIVALLAFNIAGGGDGWISALVSAVAIFLVPFAAVACKDRRRSMALIVFCCAVLADLILLAATWWEGFHYTLRVVSAAPLLILAWFFLWAGWQVGLVATFLRHGFDAHPNT